MRLVRGHHSVGEANLHLQFTPKYRQEVFRDRMVREVCEESFRETAEGLGVVVHALAFGPDHVHVFVGACKNYSVAEVVRRLKGASQQTDPAGMLGQGEEEAVGRELLEWGLLLQVCGFHHWESHTVLHPEEPRKTLDSPRLRRIQTQNQPDHHKPVHGITLKASALSSLDAETLWTIT